MSVALSESDGVRPSRNPASDSSSATDAGFGGFGRTLAGTGNGIAMPGNSMVLPPKCRPKTRATQQRRKSAATPGRAPLLALMIGLACTRPLPAQLPDEDQPLLPDSVMEQD